jgi:hypothetical protein
MLKALKMNIQHLYLHLDFNYTQDGNLNKN